MPFFPLFDFPTPTDILRAVRRTWLRILLAAYLLLWFGVIVPAHKRGVVQISPTASACDCCLCHDAAPAANNSSPAAPRQPGNCAVCDSVAHLTLPPVFDFDLRPTGLLHKLPAQDGIDLISRLVLSPFDGRGPPAQSAA